MEQSESPAAPGSSSGRRRWHPWRLVPAVLVLATVLLILLTRFGVLLANHIAYPVTLAVVGAAALLVVLRSRR